MASPTIAAAAPARSTASPAKASTSSPTTAAGMATPAVRCAPTASWRSAICAASSMACLPARSCSWARRSELPLPYRKQRPTHALLRSSPPRRSRICGPWPPSGRRGSCRRRSIRKAFQVAEQRGGFLVDAVSPMEAARAIRAPVLLIHGADDRETPPAHSQRIFEALAGPRRLLLVPGAGHNQSLNAPAVWVDIERWVEESLELCDRRLALGSTGGMATGRMSAFIGLCRGAPPPRSRVGPHPHALPALASLAPVVRGTWLLGSAILIAFGQIADPSG